MSRSQAPSYCLHRPTDQAYVTLPSTVTRPVRYLGKWGTAESLTRYEEVLKEVGYAPEQIAHAVQTARLSVSMPQPLSPPPTAAPVTVRHLYDTFLRWAPTHYRLPNGNVSGEVDNFRYSCTQFLAALGQRRTDSLTKKDMEQVRQTMVDKGLSRKVVNQRISRIRHIIRWGTEENRNLVPETVAAVLCLITPLEAFRTSAAEKTPIVGVKPKDVLKAAAAANPVIGAMMMLQLHTGMRPGEVRGLRKRMIVKREGQWMWIVTETIRPEAEALVAPAVAPPPRAIQ